MKLPHRRTFRLAAGTAVAALAVTACGSGTPKAAPAATTPASTNSAGPWPEALHDARHSGTSGSVGPKAAKVAWTRKLGGGISAGPAVAADGTIYASGNAGVLHALDPATGADRWSFNGGGSNDNGQDLSTTAAILPTGTVLWPAPRSTVFALSPAGKLDWSLHLRGSVLSPALASNGAVYVSDTTCSATRRQVRNCSTSTPAPSSTATRRSPPTEPS